MERSTSLKKRKAVTRDVDEGPAVVSGDEFDLGQLDDSSSESAGSEDSASEDLPFGDLHSDEIQSDDEEAPNAAKRANSRDGTAGVDIEVNGVHFSDGEEED